MTVNVYTYYENKLALQAHERIARRERARKARRSLKPKLGPWTRCGALLGLLIASVLGLLGSASEPTLAILLGVGLAWGGGAGIVADWVWVRLGKFAAALRGDPLTFEEIRGLQNDYQVSSGT